MNLNGVTGTAVVTGAASGIGQALATRLASQGARLVLADIDAHKPSQTARGQSPCTPT